MYINLQGGPAQMPQQFMQTDGGYHPGYGKQSHSQQQHADQQGGYQQNAWQQGGYQSQQPQQYQGQQQQYHGGPQQQNNQNQEIEAAVKKYLPNILRRLQRSCCTVM